MMGFGLVFTILLVAVVVYALGWRPQVPPKIHTESTPSALDILKVRYARGEITKTEYDTLRDELTT